MPIQRITLFKIPESADVDKVIEAYGKLKANQQKDGKPYITQQKTSKLYDDPRTQGYTLSARSVFESLEDMKYYDEECAAHAELKTVVKPVLKGGPPFVFYSDI